jgi:hypothetical protein
MRDRRLYDGEAKSPSAEFAGALPPLIRGTAARSLPGAGPFGRSLARRRGHPQACAHPMQSLEVIGQTDQLPFQLNFGQTPQ